MRNKNYWNNLSIPNIPAAPIIGNFKDVFFAKSSAFDSMMDFYNHKNAKNQPIVGINVIFKPGIVIRSPELCKQILVRDFNSFPNRYSSSDQKSDAMGSYSLFLHKNPGWKELRTKISPVFSSGKIKQMFHLVQNVAKAMDAMLIDEKYVDIKDISARYTTDVIATCAFGVEANSLNNPDAEFRKNGKHIFDFTLYRALEITSVFFFPQIVSWFRFKVFSEKSTEFLRSTLHDVMKAREESGNKRNDLIDTLLAIRDDIKNSSAIFNSKNSSQLKVILNKTN